MSRSIVPSTSRWQDARSRVCLGLCLAVIASWLLVAPGQAQVPKRRIVAKTATPTAAPLPRLFIAGNSDQQIETILNAEVQQPFCYGDFIRRVGPRFEGLPYGSGGRGCQEGQTLIQVQRMDCVTFIENILAMALTVREAQADSSGRSGSVFARFPDHLERIRYYNGNNCTWDDRIYYFSDALYQLEDQGLLRDVGAQAGVPFGQPVYYMSHNRNRFRGIRNWSRIAGIERRISQRKRYWFPYHMVDRYLPIAQDGDIIAFVTTVAGLEVSHTGFVHRKGSEVAFTHASSHSEVVTVQETLCDYLSRRVTIAGILVFRPVL